MKASVGVTTSAIDQVSRNRTESTFSRQGTWRERTNDHQCRRYSRTVVEVQRVSCVKKTPNRSGAIPRPVIFGSYTIFQPALRIRNEVSRSSFAVEYGAIPPIARTAATLYA